jgi:hypothetical protein
MDIGIVIAIVVVVIVVLAIGAAVAMIGKRKRDSKKLKGRFGPEYDRALEQHGGRKEAEGKLKEREDRRKGLDIRPLEPAQQEHFAGEWRTVQARFVDAPQQAVRESDHLVREVMRQRGYPVDDFNQRADDISVDHPHVVENYRAAGAIAERNERGEASTEDLRQATVHYRALFEDLLDTQVTHRQGQQGQGHETGGGHAGHSAGQANEAGAGGRRGEEVR